MEPRRYAGRFLVPLALFVAALAIWLIAGRVGSTPDAGSAEPTDTTESVALSAPLASVRRVPGFIGASSRSEIVLTALAGLPPDPGGLSCTAISIDGQTVVQIRADQSLVPAYAQLLVTGHAAIDILGVDHRYETQVFAQDLPDLNGRVFNGVYLIGGGDPGLMSRNYALGFRPALSTRTAIEDLAAAVADVGVLRIDGGVIGVERRYDTERSLPGWPDSLLSEGVIGPLTALQLDDGFAERAAANLGVAVPADQPASLAAERFADQLWDIEVQVFGDYRTLGEDEELPDLVPVGRVFSPALADIVFQTLAVNDATAGELILKELGVATTGEGTTQAGGRAVQDVLRDQGFVVPVPFRDGSGLGPFGGTSCNQLVGAADSIQREHPTLDVLPGYDLPGVFGGRLAGLGLSADLRLVGGVQGDASGLVGRTVDDGPQVTIASIVNRPGGPTAADLAYQIALVQMVDDLRTSTSVDDVAVAD